ncbi:MAG: sugar phosphate isomerase/epimerase [Phycisphaerales bacterium]|nr:MAG: sugar phosphate isomerase/epimerase [Phycisphaerales bacterium]
MTDLKLGIDIDDLRLDPRRGFTRAAELGFRAVEVATVAGELAPANLTHSARRHLSRFVRALGLDFTALVGDMPARLRLTDPATNAEVVDRLRDVLILARDLRVPIVTTSVSALTHPGTGEPSSHAIDALRQIADDADRTGTIFALRPAGDSAERLARLLDDLNCPAVRICLDPAAMVMSGQDPGAVLTSAADQVVLSHLRDGTAGSSEHAGAETALGEGEVDLLGHLMLLDVGEYHGPHILRRRCGDRPEGDLQAAKEYVESLLGQE